MDNLSIHSYRTLAAPSEASYRVMASRHLAYAWPVRTEEEIKAHIDRLWKDHHSATHIAYGWRLGHEKTHFRSYDDGEPGGTAGKPILGQIQSADLTNILICVARYFGGTKLGTGGLIDAYRTAAKLALDASVIIEVPVTESWELTFRYEDLNAVLKVLKDLGISKDALETGESCHLVYSLPLAKKKALELRLEDLRIKGMPLPPARSLDP